MRRNIFFPKEVKKKNAFSMGIGVSNSIFFLLLRGLQNIFTWFVIKTTSYMWCVTFTERPAGLVNSWTSMRCNLLPEVYTAPFFPLILWNLKIFQKIHTRREMKIYTTEFFFLNSSLVPLLLSAGGNNINNRALN